MTIAKQTSLPVVLTALLMAFAGCATQHAQPKTHIVIKWDDKPTLSKEQTAVWLGYLMARAAYIGEHEQQYERIVGTCVPQFEEEVSARFRAAEVYRELSAKDKKLRDGYFEDLLKVQQAGFDREYIWVYLRQPTWLETEKPPRLQAFEPWAKENIASHQVVTYGGISLHPN